MNIGRRWTFTIIAVVVAIGALLLSHFGVFGKSAEDCRPVKELLDYNRSQAEQIAAKTGNAEGIPNVAEEGAYQAWADGLAERAQNVHEPELARDATQLASLSNEFVRKFAELRTQTQSRAPGAPAPPVAFEMSVLNTQIAETLAKLTDACPS